MLRYQRRLRLLGRQVRVSFQVNVRNLLDEHDIEIRRHKTDGITLDRCTLTEPREITFSTTLRFQAKGGRHRGIPTIPMRTPAIAFALASLIACFPPARAGVRTVAESALPGPTILLVDQPADGDVSGAIAIRQVSRWTLSKGRILAATGAEADEAAKAAAPDAIVVLRVAKTAAPSTGKTKSRKATPSAPATVDTLGVRGLDHAAARDRLNALLDAGTAPLAPAPAAADGFGARTVIELSFVARRGGPSPGERTRLFRHAVHEVLAARGMTSESPWTIIDPATRKLRVAIFAGAGSTTTPGLASYPACLDLAPAEIDYTYVGPVELARPGMLDPFHVIVFCGGSGSGQAKALGDTGAAAVKDFVRRGGGYVSSCAGAYLATSGYPWSLKLIDADTVDSKHWMRGSGPVDIELTSEGRKILGDYPGLQSVRYANGPLLGKAKDSGGLAPYTVLAHFRSDMAKGVPGGVMPNTPAVIAGDYGRGRVLCFSPHPEYVEPLRGMIVRAVTWAARRS